MIKLKNISKLYWYYLKHYYFSRNWLDFLIEIFITIFGFYLFPMIISYSLIAKVTFKGREGEWKNFKSKCSKIYYSSEKSSEREKKLTKILNKEEKGLGKNRGDMLSDLNLINKDLFMLDIFGKSLKEITKNSPKISSSLKKIIEDLEWNRTILRTFFNFESDDPYSNNFIDNFNQKNIEKTIEFYKIGIKHIKLKEKKTDEDEDRNKYMYEIIKTWKETKKEVLRELENELGLSKDKIEKIEKDINLSITVLDNELKKEKELNGWEKIFQQTAEIFFGSIFIYFILGFFKLFFEEPKRTGEESLVLIFTPGVTREEIIISKFLALATCLSIFSFCTVILPIGFFFLTKNEIFPFIKVYGWTTLLYIWDSNTNILLFSVMTLFLQPIICSLLVFPYMYIREKLSRVLKFIFDCVIGFRKALENIMTIILVFWIKNRWMIKNFSKIKRMKDRPLYFVLIALLIVILFSYLYYRFYKKEDLSITTTKTE